MMMVILLVSWITTASPPVFPFGSLKNAAGGGPFCDTNGLRQGGVVSESEEIAKETATSKEVME